MNFINVPKKYQNKELSLEAINRLIIKEYDSLQNEDVINDMAFDILCLRKNYEDKCDENYRLSLKNKELQKKLNDANIKKHTYKIELGRCVRKLTRLYKALNRLKKFGENELETSKQQSNTDNALSILKYTLNCVIGRLDTDELKRWI